MLDIDLEQVWKANDIAAPKQYNIIAPKLEAKYGKISSSIIRRYKNIFWWELALHIIGYVGLMVLIFKFGFMADSLPFGSKLFALLITLVEFTVIYLFFFKYFKDLSQGLITASRLDIKSYLEHVLECFKQYKRRTMSMIYIIIGIGVAIELSKFLFVSDDSILGFIGAVIIAIFSIGFTQDYYDYLYKPYEVEVEILLRQLQQ